MNKNVKFLAKILAAVLVTSMVTACGAAPASSTTSSAATSGSAATSSPATEASKYGGTVRMAAEATPVTLFLPQSSSTNDRFYTTPVAEPLGREDVDGNVIPFLAASFATDADALTFTIKLRENVKFHDGSLCDAEAVKWNLEKYLESGKASELGNPTSIESPDATTVVIKYTTWANNWERVIAAIPIISKEAYEKNGEEWCKINIVGTGPYVLDSYVQDNKLSYKRNENYRIEGQPYLDGIEFQVITDANTRIAAFLNKEIDVMETGDAVVINQLMQAGYENVASKNANLSNIKYVIFNSKDKSKPLGDLKVRQAVMHSLDWENVAKSLSGGFGEASPLFCSPNSWAFNPDASFYEYNVEKAKQLLTEAGYPNGFSTTITTIATYNNTAVALQAALSKIGVTATINVMDNSALAAMQVNDNIDGLIAWQGGGQMDFTANYIRLYSSEGIKNHGIIEYPADYEEALFGARAAKTIEEKKTLLQKASKMLVQDYCLIFPMCVTYTTAFQQQDIHDLGYYGALATQFTPETAYRG